MGCDALDDSMFEISNLIGGYTVGVPGAQDDPQGISVVDRKDLKDSIWGGE
jgi:hypothetical protein